MIWIHHIERTIAKVLRTYVKDYSLFRKGSLSTNINLMLYKALIRPVMTYACPTWVCLADAYLLIVQSLQNKAQSTSRYWEPCQVLTSPRIARGVQDPYVYDYVCKYCRIHAGVIRNYVNIIVRGIRQGGDTRQRRWLRCYATSQKVVGSSPDEITDFFNLPSSCNMTPCERLTT
jgi:hypothetical protein